MTSCWTRILSGLPGRNRPEDPPVVRASRPNPGTELRKTSVEDSSLCREGRNMTIDQIGWCWVTVTDQLVPLWGANQGVRDRGHRSVASSPVLCGSSRNPLPGIRTERCL